MNLNHATLTPLRALKDLSLLYVQKSISVEFLLKAFEEKHGFTCANSAIATGAKYNNCRYSLLYPGALYNIVKYP